MIFWHCECSCGNATDVETGSLLNGLTRSCGCLSREMVSARFKTHGLTKTRIHDIWRNMLSRCGNKKSPHYKRYGAKGITVCEKWNDFTAFLSDVGNPPTEKHSIDRIDNARGYEPGNVRWATASEQQRNKNSNHRITVNGETMCLAEAAERYGIPYKRLHHRIIAGWLPEIAISPSRFPSGPRPPPSRRTPQP